jgi:hypothetical protein
LAEDYRVDNLLPTHVALSFIISYWVILKYVSLGIGTILDVDLSLRLPLSLCGEKAFLW